MSKRVLLVDDDADDQIFLRWAIETLKPEYNCTVANNGREAIELIQKYKPYDIVFVDLNMPLMNGFDTLSIIKKREDYQGVPIVVVSTSKNQSDIDRCKRLGATHYIVKPDSINEFVDELKHVLE